MKNVQLPKLQRRGNGYWTHSVNTMLSPNAFNESLVQAVREARKVEYKQPSLPERTTSSRKICSLFRLVFHSLVIILHSLTYLQALPKPKPKRTPETPSKIAAEEHPQQLVDPDSDVAHALQPLLEQEALLESFVEEAKARRKFEDVKTLKSNLAEIRIEIDRMMANADERGSYKPKQ